MYHIGKPRVKAHSEVQIFVFCASVFGLHKVCTQTLQSNTINLLFVQPQYLVDQVHVQCLLHLNSLKGAQRGGPFCNTVDKANYAMGCLKCVVLLESTLFLLDAPVQKSALYQGFPLKEIVNIWISSLIRIMSGDY